MRKRARRRPGFTLLELVLAMAIGMLLFVGLYVALDIHFGNAEAGRVIVDQSTVARAVLSRMANDISSNLGPYTPTKQQQAASQNTGTTTATRNGSLSAPPSIVPSPR